MAAQKTVEPEVAEKPRSELAKVQPKRVDSGEIVVDKAAVEKSIKACKDSIAKATGTSRLDDPSGAQKTRAEYFEAIFLKFERAYNDKKYQPDKDGKITVNPNELIGAAMSLIKKENDDRLKVHIKSVQAGWTGSQAETVAPLVPKNDLFNWDHESSDKLAVIQGFVGSVAYIFNEAKNGKAVPSIGMW